MKTNLPILALALALTFMQSASAQTFRNASIVGNGPIIQVPSEGSSIGALGRIYPYVNDPVGPPREVADAGDVTWMRASFAHVDEQSRGFRSGVPYTLEAGQQNREAGITVSVHNYADVPPTDLAKAEDEARRIFRQAGVSTIWLTCSPKLEMEKSEPASCSLADSTHLVLKVLQRPKSAQIAQCADVLGSASLIQNSNTYYGYAYAYYDRIRQQTDSRKLGNELLAAVFVHEIGHVLLQSHSHSLIGIMGARWRDEEFRQISEGTMYFTATESRLIRVRLDRLRLDTKKKSALD